ncbi:P-loop containing nucleoside triphosphate hydrolase protein [Hortaea werneckii]|nr:P-loop containing nucleoside triphosphate hydrolase protein [Hortaea werneckii]
MARSPSRRDDDRYRRDDRSYRRRSRSRDRERRYDDRDRRRERSRDRYDDYRSSRRDRSRERKRSRDRSAVRERERDRRRYRDDDYQDRDSKRPRRDERSPARSHRRDSRDEGSTTASVRGNESPRPSTADASAEEARKAKLARVEAWKKKMQEQKAAQATPAASAASPAVKNEDNDTASPAAQSPANGSQASATPASPGAKDDKPSSPAPYAGKFDPKAIAKRAAAAMDKQKSALGGDVVIPKSAQEASNSNGAKLADNSKVAPPRSVNGISQSLKANTKISGFGLNKAGTEKTEKPTASKGAATLDEDEQSERKLGKLPNLPSLADEPGDTAPADDVDDQDDVGDEIRSDEEEAEAAREAAQKRAQEAQAEQHDVVMTQSEEAKPEPDPDVKMGEEEEIDPLDAFMNELAVPQDPAPTLPPSRTKKNDVQVFNNDDDDDLTAVGDNTDDILALAAKRKKKDIPTVNHEKVEYEPFRKSFYSEPVELAEMSKEDLDILRADLDNITVRGKEPPKPILKWSQGGFGAQMLDVIRDMGFEKPTPIQSQTLPAIMSGRDTIGIAKTGSGKTVAYLLPMFRHIKDQRPLEKLDGPIGIVLAPTRELATQIHRDCKPYLKALNLRAVCAYGGAPIKDQIAELKRGAEIVVCTPGRMIDLLAANSGRVTNLKRVTYCVLDEADRMFDMGFEPQITKVMNNIRPDRQTVLFSATFPKSMEALARKALTKPLEIVVGGRSVVAAEITQMIEVRPDEKKFTRLLQLLGDLHEVDEDARTLIFVERQETADGMLKDLNRKGYPTVSIHGGREQVDRDQAINDFKAGVFPVMVATSVAARGLDVKQLKLVVNYDSPNHVEDYVHRAGRTGRAGNTGTAVTFVTPEQDRFASFLIRALKDSNQDIPEDLQKLEEVHQERVKAGDAKKAGSGFGGRGIERLDAARDAERARERKQYKTGEEGEEEEEEGEKKEGKQSEVDKLVAKATGKTTERDNQPAEKPAQESAQPLIPTALSDHLNNAMKVQKAATPPPPSSGPKGNDPLAKVNAAVANINSRLGARGATRPGAPIDNRGPDAGAFHATLEINDFPQKARWGVTNRTNVAKILEATGTSITNKGTFYAKGQEPEPGQQPKLYILVEGDTEVMVENAMRELTRLLKEGTVAALESEARAPASGRYNVV